MLYFRYTEKLIDLQDLIVKNVAQDQNSTTLYLQCVSFDAYPVAIPLPES